MRSLAISPLWLAVVLMRLKETRLKETRFIASLQGLTNLYIHDAVPIATHHDALVLGLALIDTLDDEGDMVDLLSFDRLVFVVFPGA